MKKALCIISGGMDSATCAYIAKNSGYEVIGVHFDYAQRTQDKERECFERICDDLGAQRRYTLDARFIAQIGANSLTDTSLSVRKGANIDKNEIPNTYVPFRNGVFLSIAGALAEREGCEAIFIGVVQEDSSGYPDCTAEFIAKMQSAINAGTSPNFSVEIKTPLVHLNKGEIVARALENGVNLGLTWSCYTNSHKACGVCDSCQLRLNGFAKAGVKDPIEYEIEI
ncbi:7-cyano-7-deazaguanine synthase QueC [Campylobacter sp. JMF_01 NE2]|uniref:7-cyano-7-deazaguanine synthase QueC n=1 Tax=unclassified Campylobacter TaxID=2593542 RepID=UPI003FA45D68